jgi:thiol-disulfide isomerase/thioredoxin
MRQFLALGALALITVACTPTVPDSASGLDEGDTVSVSSDVSSTDVAEPSNATDSSVPPLGRYTAFTEDVLTDGSTKILFFHASWCPSCKKANQDLTEMYAEEKFVVSTYKVDYDKAKDLKRKYGVIQQHTFILIDAQGNELDRIVGGTRAQLDEFIDKAGI